MASIHLEDDPDWHDKVKADLEGRFRKLLDVMADDARTLAPVDTGLLKKSINSEVVDETTGIVRAGVYYAPYVEEGHRVAYRGADGQKHYTGEVVPPQPFLKPSLFRKRDLDLE